MTDKSSDIYIEKIIISGFKCIRQSLTVNLNKPLIVLVGNNGVGKTTILEAIHLALTGQYRGMPIRRVLSQSLFNKEDVQQFLKSFNNKDMELPKFPNIKIEVFLNDAVQTNSNDNHLLALFSGAVNSMNCKQAGFTFSIEFDDNYVDSLKETQLKNTITSLPLEYYTVKWKTFADSLITPRALPIHSIMMNPTGEWLGGYSDQRASQTFVNRLTDGQQMTLAQNTREALDEWNRRNPLKDMNIDSLSDEMGKFGKIDIAMDSGTVDSWKKNMVVRLNSIPYSYIGAGLQSILQTHLALGKKPPAKSTLLLFEEPENHLSHTNLNVLMKMIAREAGCRRIILTTHSSFVANVLGLEHLQIVNRNNDSNTCFPLTKLSENTKSFFKKLPGYDTLRLVLARAAILVEGPSDELIVQLGYWQTHNGKLPIENGIDVISVGTGFLHFLELAYAIQQTTLVLTDNDGHPEKLRSKYQKYSNCTFIEVKHGVTKEKPQGAVADKLNWNTLEAEMLYANSFEVINQVLGTQYPNETKLLNHMEENKTDTALKIFNAALNNKVQIKMPEYIADGLKWMDSHDKQK